MSLPTEPRLPAVTGKDWPTRLTQRLTEIFREWAKTLNPWIGPSWEDLRFPAQGINPSGAPTAASFDTTTYYGTLLFSGSAENHIAGVAQMPHGWRAGSSIRPHIHWTKTVADAPSDGVTWEFRAARVPISATAEAYGSWVAGTLVAGNLVDAELHCISAFGDYSMTGLTASDMVIWGLRRRGDTDSYSSVCRLLEMDFHFEWGSVGTPSKLEYPEV